MFALSAAGQGELFQRDANAMQTEYAICLAEGSITLLSLTTSSHQDGFSSSNCESSGVILPRLSSCLKVPIDDPDRLRR